MNRRTKPVERHRIRDSLKLEPHDLLLGVATVAAGAVFFAALHDSDTNKSDSTIVACAQPEIDNVRATPGLKQDAQQQAIIRALENCDRSDPRDPLSAPVQAYGHYVTLAKVILHP